MAEAAARRAAGGLLAAAAGASWVVAWRALAPSGGCWVWVLPLVVWVLLAVAFARPALRWRRCLVACVLDAASPWRRWLRGRLWLPLRAAVGAALVTGVLALEVLSWPTGWTAVVLVTLPIPPLAASWLARRLADARPHWREVIAAAAVGRAYAVLMVVLFAGMQLFSPPPVVVHPGLVDTVREARAAVAAVCPALREVAGLRAEIAASAWWLLATEGARLDTAWLRALAWAGFLLSGGLAFYGLARSVLELTRWVAGGGAAFQRPSAPPSP